MEDIFSFSYLFSIEDKPRNVVFFYFTCPVCDSIESLSVVLEEKSDYHTCNNCKVKYNSTEKEALFYIRYKTQ